MNIAVLGTGYVGLSTGVCLAEIGHEVTCVDIDKDKVELLNNGISPIYEPGIEELIVKNKSAGRLHFTTSHKNAFQHAEIIIIAVGTPENPDGSVNMTYLEQAAKDIAQNINRDTIIIIKSTVPVGTNDYIKKRIEQHLPTGLSIAMISNPEFLREGSAIKDTLQADRIIIGSSDQRAAEKIRKMYEPIPAPVLMTDIRTAETIKYASNAFLATKISFINQVAIFCESVGADVKDVAIGMGMDKRIGNYFLNAGIGYGGSCFPKDVKAFIHTASQYGIDFTMLKETMAINQKQQEFFVKKVTERFNGDVKDKAFALLGLAFKPETDDMRESPAIRIANTLSDLGANITAYDPVAIENAKKIIGTKISYAYILEEAVKDKEALLIITDWKEFKGMDLKKILSLMKSPIIFDGRNCLVDEQLNELNLVEYYPIGRPSIFRK